MGKIKKILENELVGGTQSTDVYPVTSVKAVYDENNKRLDNVLGDLDDKIDTLKDTIGSSFKVEAQYTNKYINIGGAKVGDIIDTETLIPNLSYDCAIYSVSEGDIINITGTGGYGPRLWTFLDEEKRLISTSVAGAKEYNTILIAPPNTAFVVFSWEKTASAQYVFDATISPISGLIGTTLNHTIGIANINADLKNIIFSNDSRLNRIIKELYLYDTTSIKNKEYVTIRCGLKSASTDKYFNSIRLGVDDRTSPNFGYVDLYFEYFETQEDALAAMRSSSVISTSIGVAIIDTSSIELGELYKGSAICKDYSQLYNAPSIAIFLSESKKKEVGDKKMVLAQANTLAINGDNAYQCPDQFKAGSLVKVYRQGLLVNPSEYTLFKQGKVQFNDTTDVPPSDILFEYEKNTKHINSRSLLLDSTSQLAYQTEDASTQLYSFVNDPTGGDQKVMMLHCSQITALKVRMQFQLKNLHATYFHDRVKMFLPTDMKNALLSYSGAINWFSIGGSWGIFGSSTGQLSNMYSGSANSFDIFKDAGGNRLYFHQINRRRDVNTETGLEEYTVLSEGSSTFDILDNEWITIEREFQAGNPGFCKYKITDSKGVHTMEVNPAYNVVCDVENEKQRYGDKLINDIPYNEFPAPFVAKIYTSNAVVQHCIDTIGKVYLYFKEYELIEATAVNIY